MTDPEVERLPADADAPGNDEVQRATDEASDQGYLGTRVDERDDSEYTVEGVTKNAE